jgi:hypothetical protein
LKLRPPKGVNSEEEKEVSLVCMVEVLLRERKLPKHEVQVCFGER